VSIPKNLQEGFLWDFMELFRGEGSLSEAHRALGLRVHPGFEVKDGSHGDLLLDSTMQAAIGLITRRVVRAVHVAAVCASFGTLRRPRVRSNMQPFGFDFTEAATALGNHFAVRAAFILFLCLANDIVGAGEQLRGPVMFRLDMFMRLLKDRFFSVHFPYCKFGAPFEKRSWWISSNPHHRTLGGECSCGHKAKHFRVQGSFTKESLKVFERRCRPNLASVFLKLLWSGNLWPPSVLAIACL